MWVLLSEIFPNEERAAAISVVGFWNSLVSASVTLLFPWSSQPGAPPARFLAYGLLAAAGLLFIVILAPETKGKTLEELEGILTQPKQVMGLVTAGEGTSMNTTFATTQTADREMKSKFPSTPTPGKSGPGRAGRPPQDGAREAGVSASTVSRIINGTVNVSGGPQACRRGRPIVKFNFRPNAAARGLALGKTLTIGVVAQAIEQPVLWRGLRGIRGLSTPARIRAAVHERQLARRRRRNGA